MKPTYREAIVRCLVKEDRPLQAKTIIWKFQMHCDANVSHGTLRETINIAVKKGVICRVKIQGFVGLYCLPEWFDGLALKENYIAKIYESKQV